ncbi:uncharacterized protein LOC143228209 [Tachypleus tridentatus]|uniref:uncharacterized protein LOC143228209 n=1 Tax=Tachypleus tridentatus TaxID=6853 RepID=UPI003FCF0E86
MEVRAVGIIVLLIALTIQMFQCRPTQNIRHNRVFSIAFSKLYRLLHQRTSSPSKFSRFLESSKEGTIIQSLDPLSGKIVVKRSLNNLNGDRFGSYTLTGGGPFVISPESLRVDFLARPVDTLNEGINVRSLDPLKHDVVNISVDSSTGGGVNRFSSLEKIMVKSPKKSTMSSNFNRNASRLGKV